MTFWDFCAPIYDSVQGDSFRRMVESVKSFVPQGANILEAAAGTGSISVAVADTVATVLCTDLSPKMLNIAKIKARRNGVRNINFAERSIYELGEEDSSFDVVIASQVLHLLDDPTRAAAELRRVSRGKVITAICLTRNLRGFAQFKINVFRLFGFAPKHEFDLTGYQQFLTEIGLPSKITHLTGQMPYAVAVCDTTEIKEGA
jgi:ubiquinone/menaquinone biosynthesis C-methylase UbiE